jgi:hypothetical protein
MPNNPGENPYDEFLRQLAKIVEEIMKNLPDQENTRFIGCTIISGNVSGPSPVNPAWSEEDQEISYEVIYSEDRIFITARIPAGMPTYAYADIRPDSIVIHVGDREATIVLETPADIIHSFYRVRHGVMDIVVSKVKLPVRESH